MRTFRVEYRDESDDYSKVEYWTEEQIKEGLQRIVNNPIISFTLAIEEVEVDD